MNSIKTLNRIDFYADNTRGARYQRIEYDNAVNDAIQNFIDSILNPDEKTRETKGFQADQYISDNLYTLQKLQTAAPTSSIALYPTDYQFMTSMWATIAGTPIYCRPTTQNKLGPLKSDTYRAPSATKPYYLQVPTGFKIESGSGTVTSVDFYYIKTPTTYTCGKDSQLIDAGVGVITAAATYLVTEPAAHNSVSYNIGDSFVAANTTLTSGQVILASLTVPCELPEKVQEAICKLAAGILLKASANYQAGQSAEIQGDKA